MNTSLVTMGLLSLNWFTASQTKCSNAFLAVCWGSHKQQLIVFTQLGTDYAEKAADFSLSKAFVDAEKNYHWTHFGQPFVFNWKVQWGHGAPGVAIFLNDLLPELGAEVQARYRPALEGSIRTTEIFGPDYAYDEGGQCCGKSGQGELFLRLYNSTGKVEYLEHAVFLAKILLDENGNVKTTYGGAETPKKYQMSLDSYAGIGLFFLRIADPKNSSHPHHLL